MARAQQHTGHIQITALTRRSVVAIPKRTYLHTVIRPLASTAPRTARSALTPPVVAVPAPAVALTRTMIAVNLDDVAVIHAIDGSNGHRRGARDRRHPRKKSSGSQSFDHTFHSNPSKVLKIRDTPDQPFIQGPHSERSRTEQVPHAADGRNRPATDVQRGLAHIRAGSRIREGCERPAETQFLPQ